MSGFPIHKRHTGFLRPFEAGQVLVVVDDLLIRFHLFRLEGPDLSNCQLPTII